MYISQVSLDENLTAELSSEYPHPWKAEPKAHCILVNKSPPTFPRGRRGMGVQLNPGPAGGGLSDWKYQHVNADTTNHFYRAVVTAVRGETQSLPGSR
ncbi:unnamed protein product [Gadus morhua 'NCC']